MKFYFLLLFLLCCETSNAQEQMTIHFDFDKSNLSSTAKSSLDSLVSRIKIAAPKIQLELTGHTDAIGSNSYNDQLSQRRINSVRSYLVSQGILKENITDEKPFGETDPVVENSSAENRALNRRVEIRIISETSSDKPVTLKEKIADSTVVAGSNIVLRNINFYGGMHQFLPESEAPLKELLDALRTYPKLVIRIEGHICCQPGPQDGLDIETNIRNLSEARAKAIMDYLINAGIEPSRLSYKGFAHTNPLFPYPERTEEEQTLNRRVEIKIISK